MRTKVTELQAIKRQADLIRGTTYTNIGVILFRLFGRYWSTNKRRKKMYRMHDIGWKAIELSLFDKLLLIVLGKAHTIKPRSIT